MATITEEFLTDIAFSGGDLVKKANSGDLDTVSGIENRRRAIMRRIFTRKGSVIHRPNYGVGIMDFQGAMQTLEMQEELVSRIEEQLTLDRFVEKINRISIDVDDTNPSLTKVAVSVKLVGYGDTEVSFLPFGETP